MNKKIILTLISIILISGIAFLLYKRADLNKEIETFSANVINDNEIITAGDNGTVLSLKYKNLEKVKVGDIIAELDISSTPKSNCVNEKEASDEYKDAAIMYKDGVISKEEYDKSLNEYKEETKNTAKNCGQKSQVIKSIYANADGVISYSDIKEGDSVKFDTEIGTVNQENANIKAYFSPKYKHRIKEGDKAKITIVKYPEKVFEGKVSSIDKIDINGQGITLKVTQDTSDLLIKNGDAAIVVLLKK
ncbi:MAG: HlyD family efflux transporter periplasmic adaptor subunit [Candidatus Gastranaerophilaceae bacterium]|nr:HlyD family efflux transporter periplasmic adaptor subunit [Candidatus Gastranaerophilaceae bacterium]